MYSSASSELVECVGLLYNHFLQALQLGQCVHHIIEQQILDLLYYLKRCARGSTPSELRPP